MKKLLFVLMGSVALTCCADSDQNNQQNLIANKYQNLYNYLSINHKNSSLFYLQNHPDTLKQTIEMCSSYQFNDRSDTDGMDRMNQICDNIASALSQGILTISK